MSLAHIEEMCRSQHIPYHKDDEDLVLELRGSVCVFPTLVSQQKCGSLQALVWFPPNEAVLVEGADEFCRYVEEIFSSRVQTGLYRKKNQFWAGCIFDVSQFMPSLGTFVGTCDILMPLFLRVGCLGRWHPDLVSLACLAPEDCAGRA